MPGRELLSRRTSVVINLPEFATGAVMPDSHRFGASRAIPWLLVIALAAWPAAPSRAQDRCRLTSDQKLKAVKAFKALSPIFYDPRCINCHGAVNPFTVDGGHPEVIDIVAEAKKFLSQPDPAAGLIDSSGPRAAPELQGIREIAASETEVSDIDVIRNKALKPMLNKCAECHQDNWFQPMRENHFTRRSWKQICMHLKSASLTNTPRKFLKHMQEDPQVLLGVEGQRGLLSPPRAVPPAMPYETMVKHAKDWVAAMDDHFYTPAECGCEVDGLALEIRHRIYTNPDSSSSKIGRTQFDGTVVFNVLLEEVAEGRYYNDEIIVRRDLEVKHTKPSFWQCSGTGWRDELWQISADLDEAKQSLLVRFGFVDEAPDDSWTCKAKGHVLTDTVYVDVRSFLKDLTLSTEDGAIGQKAGQLPAGQTDTRYIKQFESITVSLIDLPPSQN